MLSQPTIDTLASRVTHDAPAARYARTPQAGAFSLLKVNETGDSGRQAPACTGWKNAFGTTNMIAARRSLNPRNRSSG